MAINVSFNGATIYKPGAYSKTTIDLGGGFPLSPTGIVAIFGEADAGAPGSAETNIANNVFGPDQIVQIREKYGKGNIVDAATFLFSPGADGAIPGGAQAVYIFKTNASVRAMLDPVAAGATAFGRLRARQWGTSGNAITFRNTVTPEVAPTVTGTALTLPVVITAATNDTIITALNGGAEVTATIPAASYATAAALATAIDGVLTGISAAASGTTAVTLTQDAAANLQRNGTGRAMEVVGGTALTVLGLSAGLVSAASEPMASLVVRNPVTTMEESAVVGGNVVVTMGRDATGGATAASVAISATTLTLSQTSATPASIVLTIADFPTIQSIVDYVNTLPGWSAAASSILMGQMSPTILDRATADAFSAAGNMPARIKKDAKEVSDFFALSSMVELIPATSATETKKVGLPDQQGVPNALYLSGGSKGASTSADMVTALSKFEKFRVNAIVPLFSRDATEDAADLLTDPSSSYTIAGIHQAVKTHLSLMATTKKKSERQGYLSIKASYADAKTQIATMADARIQMTIQDIRQSDSEGNIKWFQPWAGSALLAGARGGSPIGNPMTFKYFNMSGIRQTAQPMSTAEQDIVVGFDPDTMYDDAIANALTFWEAPQTGGFRLVVDNTTYNKDGNWVYNRGNVLYAADVLAYDFRNQLENIYVGMKNTVSAAEIKSTCEAILTTYLAQGITVSTGDAKNGFKQLVVQINGNTVNVAVVVKLVEGIDFVLADITLQRASQTA